MTEPTASPVPLRIAAFHVEPGAWELIRGWAERRGHEIVLLVTTPGPPPRTYKGYQEIVAAAPSRQEVLVTTRFRRATPIIAAARPDLILSYTFPTRLPNELIAVPPLGAVNLHPAPLPRFRGPNPHRMVFQGEPTIGAALHRMVPTFDAGPVLAVREAPLPVEPTLESVRALYDEVLLGALDEGVRRAAAREWGTPQDEASATYAAGFTDDDRWLDWSLSVDELRLRAIALNLVEVRARARVAGDAVPVLAVAPVESSGSAGYSIVPGDLRSALPGTVLGRGPGWVVVRTSDSAARVDIGPGVATPLAGSGVAQ